MILKIYIFVLNFDKILQDFLFNRFNFNIWSLTYYLKNFCPKFSQKLLRFKPFFKNFNKYYAWNT